MILISISSGSASHCSLESWHQADRGGLFHIWMRSSGPILLPLLKSIMRVIGPKH